MTFKIEKGVRYPGHNRTGLLDALYDTLFQMEAGDSFAISKDMDPDDRLQYRIVAWGRNQLPARKFRTIALKDGNSVRRVWRVL